MSVMIFAVLKSLLEAVKADTEPFFSTLISSAKPSTWIVVDNS